ncbi:hypothetical protein EAH74_32525 [Pseudomonas mandelii]|uniref:Uncharacterized protein n=1 Tax=Pseudomonas mandelii TaxID=75612 RepID=A0A502HJC7_9PSED|nr:hypothetical protein EAH74_32525 [Pseudomonas mandelii]
MVIAQTATVTELTIADETEKYSIPLDTLTSGWKTTSLVATFYDNQTLHTLNTTVEDKTAAVVKAVVSTALSTARIVTGIPAASGEPSLCHDYVYKALRTINEGTTKLMDQSLDEKTRANWVASITHAKSILKFSETYVFDPDKNNKAISISLRDSYIESWIANFSEINAAPQEDKQRFQRLLTTGIQLSAPPPVAALPPSELTEKGIIYREPINATIKVSAGAYDDSKSETIATYSTQIAQLGRYAILPLKNRPFEKNNIAVSFAPNGRLESATYGAESRFEKIATTVSESATAYEGYASKKRSTEAAEDAADASAPLQTVKTETEMLNAKADKIEAERRLTGLGGQ